VLSQWGGGGKIIWGEKLVAKKSCMAYLPWAWKELSKKHPTPFSESKKINLHRCILEGKHETNESLFEKDGTSPRFNTQKQTQKARLKNSGGENEKAVG